MINYLFSFETEPMKEINNMKKLTPHLLFSGALALALATTLLTGCASTKVVDREQLVTGPLPRPGTIWVYDFAATAADVPANSALADEDLDTTPQTTKQIAEGRKLGAQIATELVTEIRAMGMSAEQATTATIPKINDIVIRGYLLSYKQGDAAERVIVGFGTGKSSLSTMVEGFQMTDQGLRKLGFGDVNAGGNDSPGMVLGVATFLATKNPAGLIINAGVQTYGEASGSDEVTGRAKATAKEIGEVIKKKCIEQGWLN
jgi:hypothetical protein